MKRLTTILTILTITVWTNMFGQTVGPEIDKIVKGIAKDNMLKSAGVGIAGARTDQWDRYIALKTKATNEELINLTDSENGVVRCYSFQALATRKNINLLPILIKHLTDTTTITTFQGCIISDQMVGDYFLDVVTPQYIDLDAYKLTENERQQVDSILIFNKSIRLSAKSEVLRKLKPEQKLYDRIREIVVDEKSNSALIALSKFQNPKDKDFIIEKLKSTKTDIQYYGLQAVKNYPDSSFFYFLSEIHSVEIKKPTGFNYSMLRTLYQAIVQYKNKESRELLEQTLNSTKGSTLQYHSEFIWLALELYPDPIYDGIQGRIKLSDYKRSDLQYWIDNKDR
ncbi:MAG: hypothetical protein GW771_12285 [Flavobacteriia bacterium]|nr:hypothetical protein [Flavobacteriia bacterium]